MTPIRRKEVSRLKELMLHVEELEQRIAPDLLTDIYLTDGNNNPGQNNTNNPGLEGNNISTGATPQPNP